MHGHHSSASVESVHYSVIIFGQLKVEDINILHDAFLADGLGYRNDSQFDQISQHDLGRGLAVFIGNQFDLLAERSGWHPQWSQWAKSGDQNVAISAEFR